VEGEDTSSLSGGDESSTMKIQDSTCWIYKGKMENLKLKVQPVPQHEPVSPEMFEQRHQMKSC
jgi:hypothetical protein